MSEHTPGPWEFRSLQEGWAFYVVGGKDQDGCICGHEADYDPLWDKAPSIADATLIAAAPDMLAALKAAEEWLSGWASADPYIGVIRAAIAKAEPASPKQPGAT